MSGDGWHARCPEHAGVWRDVLVELKLKVGAGGTALDVVSGLGLGAISDDYTALPILDDAKLVALTRAPGLMAEELLVHCRVALADLNAEIKARTRV